MLTEKDKSEALKWIKEGRKLDIVADLMGLTTKELLMELDGISVQPKKEKTHQKSRRKLTDIQTQRLLEDWNNDVPRRIMLRRYHYKSWTTLRYTVSYYRRKRNMPFKARENRGVNTVLLLERKWKG